MIIGLTGGIASGKSAVSEYLKNKYGVGIVDADEVAREALNIGTSVYNKVVQNFGQGILLPDKSINRSALAEIVFQNKTKLALLNSLTHPYAIDVCAQRIQELKSLGDVVLDCALLIETGLNKNVDSVWVVTADIHTRINRATARGITRKDAMARIASQTDDDNRLRYADAVIDNSKDLKHLYRQVDKLYLAVGGINKEI